MKFAAELVAVTLPILCRGATTPSNIRDYAPPPKPEPISIIEIPLPPATANTSLGSCTLQLNPRRTGCISLEGTNSGSFLPDGIHITASVTFVGAPAEPDPASVYAGLQLILLKSDGTTFPNGDSWKCITCGVPKANKVGSSKLSSYPQAFDDGKRVLIGNNIVECGNFNLKSQNCTPDKVRVYPIRWSNSANDTGAGPGGLIRELRLHPDQKHLAFNSFTSYGGRLGEAPFIGRLLFNASGTNGSYPRYELTDVNLLANPDLPAPVFTTGDCIFVNYSAISVGEIRGFTGTGKELTYIGSPVESCNIDVFAVDLGTGVTRRITAHPEYADPMAVSPDDKWQVVLDTRGTGRQMFIAGLRGIPPLTDLVSITASSSTRNNGARRFFQPWLIDHDGDRGQYYGQRLNAAGTPYTGSGKVDDANWNAGADPRWSPDGTRIVYYQMQAIPPACGGTNPLPCEDSTEPYGLQSRVMVAHLTSRQPLVPTEVDELPDVIPWALPYAPGMEIPPRPLPVAGNYMLRGERCGHADVTIVLDATGSYVETVNATYHNFSDDGLHFLDGTESVTQTPESITATLFNWNSNLTLTGASEGSKTTSPNGFYLRLDVLTNIFEANGTLTTTVDGVSYYQPLNGA